MISLNEIIQVIDWIEKHPIIGTALIGSIVYTVKGIIGAIHKKLANKSIFVNPKFWTLGMKYKIGAVLKFTPSNDPSGYSQVQHSRPDQWCALINIKSDFMNCRHIVVPIKPSDALHVIISRDGVEDNKIIKFNK